MIDLCLGTNDELMKKEEKDWRPGVGGRAGEKREAITGEEEERIERQGKGSEER